jgi:hypothetical protein
MASETNPQITVYNHTTGETTVRDMTAEELAQIEPIGTDETPSAD